MDISTSTTIILTINGQTYSFASPHPIEDLVAQLTQEQSNLALWQERAATSQANVDALTAQITTLCVSPA